MVASLPDFWQLYFQAAAAKSDFAPAIIPFFARTQWIKRRA